MEGKVEKLNKWTKGTGFFFEVAGKKYFGDGTPEFKQGDMIVFNVPDLEKAIDKSVKAESINVVTPGSDLDEQMKAVKRKKQEKEKPARDLSPGQRESIGWQKEKELRIMKQVALKVAGKLAHAQALIGDERIVNVHTLIDNAGIMFDWLKDGV